MPPFKEMLYQERAGLPAFSKEVIPALYWQQKADNQGIEQKADVK